MDAYARPVSERIVVLGAGFGGLELATVLSETLGKDAGVTVIDDGDAFVFGYSKLDVMFGRAELESVRSPYSDFAKPGVRFLAETITEIDPDTRRVTTSAGVHEADVLVVALGADYDFDATPGLAEGGNESTPWPAPRGSATCSRRSRVAARSWASAARRSSVRPRRARRRSSFTIFSSSEACETTARSRS